VRLSLIGALFYLRNIRIDMRGHRAINRELTSKGTPSPGIPCGDAQLLQISDVDNRLAQPLATQRVLQRISIISKTEYLPNRWR
jgi:hypothetical protein